MTIAKFGRVSEKQYAEAMKDRDNYLPVAEIPLPRRATAGSAGYDFVSPLEVTVPGGGSALIPTGIRAEMEKGWVLLLFPRSSLGFRHGIPDPRGYTGTKLDTAAATRGKCNMIFMDNHADAADYRTFMTWKPGRDVPARYNKPEYLMFMRGFDAFK